MVPLAALWLPILVSGVVVFLASWIVHMLLPHHRSDFLRLPQEDAVLDSLRSLSVPTGQYLAPYANSPAQMKQPEYLEKRKRGPALFMTIVTGSDPGMGKPLAQWFVYLLVISLFCAYAAGRVLAAGAPYPAVDLVPATLDCDRQLFHRWFDLRTPDGGRVRMAVAAIGHRGGPPAAT
jgi:hypothetical protein